MVQSAVVDGTLFGRTHAHTTRFHSSVLRRVRRRMRVAVPLARERRRGSFTVARHARLTKIKACSARVSEQCSNWRGRRAEDYKCRLGWQQAWLRRRFLGNRSADCTHVGYQQEMYWVL